MKYLIIAVLLTVLYIAFNQRLQTTFYEIESHKIKNRVRIAVLGDLHCELYGKNQIKIIKAIEKANPDVVVFTGDIFDKHCKDRGSETLLKLVGERYKSFFVNGNHEFKRGVANTLPEKLKSLNVTHLRGEAIKTEINGTPIVFCGVDDISCNYFMGEKDLFQSQIKKVANREDKNLYSVLLCHQPQITKYHKQSDVDLVISGHAHGGQWRLPFLRNGLFCPDEGLFPKYSAGLVKNNGYNLVVTRGLARHAVPIPRIFNRPEIAVIDLYCVKH